MAHDNTGSNFAAEEDLMNKEFRKNNLNNINKKEFEKDINPENPASEINKKNEELIDPMACEASPEDLEAKKKKWMDIFQRCPDFANWILEIYEGVGSAGLDDIMNAYFHN